MIFTAIFLSIAIFSMSFIPQLALAKSQTHENVFPYGKGILKFEKPDASPCYFSIPNPEVKTVDPQKGDSLLNFDDKYANFFIVLGNQNDDSYQYLQIALPLENGFPAYLLDLRKGDQRLRGEFFVDYDNLAVVLVTGKQVNQVSEEVHKKYLGGNSLDVTPTTTTLGPGDYNFGAILLMSDNTSWVNDDKCAFYLNWSFSVNDKGMVLTYQPQVQVGMIVDVTEDYTPLKQHRLGVNGSDIKCKAGLQVILQEIDESGNKRPACVKPETEEKLIERGWTTKL